MSLPAVGDRCFYDLRLGKFGMYFKFYGFDGSNSRQRTFEEPRCYSRFLSVSFSGFLKLTAYFIFMIFRIVLGISMLSFKAPNCRAWQPMA